MAKYLLASVPWMTTTPLSTALSFKTAERITKKLHESQEITQKRSKSEYINNEYFMGWLRGFSAKVNLQHLNIKHQKQLLMHLFILLFTI